MPRLRRADLLVEVGLELEVGWLPVLLTGARRTDLPRIAVGDLIEPLGVPTGTIDRSHGHVHGAGNPHAICDPLVGWRVAKAIAGTGERLRPGVGILARRDAFAVALASVAPRAPAALYRESGVAIAPHYTQRVGRPCCP